MSSLIIDDEPKKVLPLMKALDEVGIPCYRAETNRQALDILASKEDEITSIFVDGSLIKQQCPFLDPVYYHDESFPSLVVAIRRDRHTHCLRRIFAISADPVLRWIDGNWGCDEEVPPDVPEVFVSQGRRLAVMAELEAADSDEDFPRRQELLGHLRPELVTILQRTSIVA